MKKILLMAAFAGVLLGSGSCGRFGNGDNPFFSEWDTPFGIPPFEKIYARHYLPAVREGIRQERREIKKIADSPEEPTFDNVISAYVGTGKFLKRTLAVFENLCAADMTDSLQRLQPEIQSLLTRHNNDIMLNKKLFARIKQVYDSRETLALDAQQMRLLEKVYRSFVRNGAELSEADQEKLRNIDERLAGFEIVFANNLLKEMENFKLVVDDESDLSGLPASVRETAAAAAKAAGMEGKWVFTLDKPSLIPFMQYADNAGLRKRLYEGYLTRCNHDDEYDNKGVADSLITLRRERACLLGYDSHADYVVENRMAKTRRAVYSLLNKLWVPAMINANRERDVLQEMKARSGAGDTLEMWDWWYYAEKLRKAEYDLDDETLRPYFPLEGVRDGIFKLVDTLYGITFRPVADVPVYHEECRTYEALDRDGSHLGVIIMDFFPRKGKGVGAWCTTFREQTYENGVRVAPVTSIVCNFTRPSGDTPALLSLDEVNTFFHEFGHAVHNLVSDVRYEGLQHVALDFVELPSQIMENWSVAPEMLKLYARHYRTGEVIPDVLIEKIKKSALFNQGFLSTEYLAAAYLDMDYHALQESLAGRNLNEIENYFLEGRMITPQVAPRYRTTYFQHIFAGGYSAGYYSYIWSEVLDADAFQAFEETGNIFDPTVARKFRTLLEKGGSEDEGQLYREFRGKDPDIEYLIQRRGLTLER